MYSVILALSNDSFLRNVKMNYAKRLMAVIFFLTLFIPAIPIECAEVSSGTSNNLDAYRRLYSYSLPQGKSPNDIVGIGIAGSNDYVYVWFNDGTVSSGTSDNLGRYKNLYRYNLPYGKSPNDIAGIGIAGSNDHVYVWFK